MMSFDTTSQLSREIEGVKTDIVVQRFADRVLVLVTQLGKVGNLIQATIPSTTPFIPALTEAGLPEPPSSIQITHILGSAPSQRITALHELYASQIASIVWTNDMAGLEGVGSEHVGVIVGLALKKASESDEQERSRFTGIVLAVQELLRKTFTP